jgi:hypothetical protein
LREAYAALADNRGDQGRSVGFMIDGGSIHVKSGLLPGSHLAFASKVNVNLPDNWKLRQLPTIQGYGRGLGREGRPPAGDPGIDYADGYQNRGHGGTRGGIWRSKAFKRLAIIGCGAQAGYQLEAVKAVFPVETVRVFDTDAARAEAFARTIRRQRARWRRRRACAMR